MAVSTIVAPGWRAATGVATTARESAGRGERGAEA